MFIFCFDFFCTKENRNIFSWETSTTICNPAKKSSSSHSHHDFCSRSPYCAFFSLIRLKKRKLATTTTTIRHHHSFNLFSRSRIFHLSGCKKLKVPPVDVIWIFYHTQQQQAQLLSIKKMSWRNFLVIMRVAIKVLLIIVFVIIVTCCIHKGYSCDTIWAQQW